MRFSNRTNSVEAKRKSRCQIAAIIVISSRMPRLRRSCPELLKIPRVQPTPNSIPVDYPTSRCPGSKLVLSSDENETLFEFLPKI
jgi:hypothetical protein